MKSFSLPCKLLALSLFFAFSGCGKFDRLDDGGFTRVSFDQGGKKLTSAVINGGMVIYANSVSYSTNLKISGEDQPASITLPNGVYTFYGFAYTWSGGEASITGDVRCAVTSPIPLNGASQNVSLNFSGTNCSDSGFFAPAEHVLSTNGTKYFRGFNVTGCGSSVDVSTKVSTDNCGSSHSWSGVAAYKVVIPIYKASSTDSSYVKLGEAYRSSCASGSTGLSPGFYVPSNYLIPMGIPGSTQRFPTELEIYAETSCTTKVTSYRFPRGVTSDPSEGIAHPTLSTSSPFVNVFIRQP